MDLSKVSTADLQAFKAGNLGAVSNEGLLAMRELHSQPAPQAMPQEQGFFPKTMQNLPKHRQQIADIPSTDTYVSQGLQTLGGGMGVLGDIGADVSSNIGKAAYHGTHWLTPELTDLVANAPKNIVKGAGYIANKIDPKAKEHISVPAQYIKQKYDEYIPEGSESRRNVEALGNVARGELNTVPLLQGAQALAPYVPKIAKGLVETGKQIGGGMVDAGSSAMGALKSAPVPTSVKSFSSADKAYETLDQSGTMLSPGGVQNVVNEAKKAANLDPQVLDVLPDSETAKVVQGLDRLAARGEPVKIQTLHKIVKGLNQKINKHFREGLDETGYELLDLRDSLLKAAKANPDDLIGGAEGFDAWDAANEFYTEGNRLKDIERIVKIAKKKPNAAAALQTRLTTLADNAKKTRGYSEVQMGALNRAGSRGLGTDALQVAGNRLIPTLALSAGGATGGVPGAIIAGGVAQAGTTALRGAATGLQMRKVNALLRELGTSQTATPAQKALAKALMEAK